MNKKNIKIAYVSTSSIFFYTFMRNIASELIREECAIYAIVPDKEYFNEIRAMGVNVIIYSGKRDSLNPASCFASFLELIKIFKNARFDLVHIHTLKCNVLCPIAAKAAGIPVIINSIPGLGHIWIERSIKIGIIRFFVKALLKISFKASTKIIFHNNDDAKEFDGWVDQDKVIVGRDIGIDVDYFSKEKVDYAIVEKIKKEIGYDNDTVVVSIIARLIKEKGVWEFIEAAHKLRKKYSNVIFIMCGWADEKNPTALKQKDLDDIRRQKNIILPGKINAVREYLFVTDIMVLPTYREGGAQAVVEAMVMEKPVVTTDVPGCREVITDGKEGFLVKPRDADALAGAIGRLIDDKELRVRMGNEGYKKAVQHYSNKIIQPRVIALYKRLLNNMKVTRTYQETYRI